MGMLSLTRLMSKQRRRRRRPQIYARNGWVASQAKRKGSPSRQDDNSLGSQIKGYSGSNLPEDIWCFIHSLMPMRDAAQVACVSRAFLHSWRSRPKLDFSEDTLFGSNKNACQNDDKARNFNKTIDNILEKHSGIGLKALKFEVPSVYNEDRRHLAHLDNWLQIAVKPGIEELCLSLIMDGNYNFPCSLLSGGTGDQLRYLSLACCVFHPTIGLGCLKSLTRLQLTLVPIKASELGCLLSSSFALEMLELRYCNSIVCLKIPCLQRLSYLELIQCGSLKAVESKAPNLSTFWFSGDLQVKLGETWRIKKLYRSCNNIVFYARTELPSSMPNLEALTISSYTEMVSIPMLPSKFFHLKFLSISVGGTFDYLSLVSFLDASPALETFILKVTPESKERVSVFDDPSDLRVMPEHHHPRLKDVKIIKFSDAKSVVELTCHILSSPSLECLTLDTTHGLPRCSVNKNGKCIIMVKVEDVLAEAHKGILAAETFVKPKVPTTVEFKVLEPCSRCHAVGL